jgi:hypothetical protein
MIYGHGRQNKTVNTATIINTTLGPSALVTDYEESLETGGVETELTCWYHEAIEHALTMTEDEPTLEEALEGSER